MLLLLKGFCRKLVPMRAMRHSLRYCLFVVGTCAVLAVVLTRYPIKLQTNQSERVVKVNVSSHVTTVLTTSKPQPPQAKHQPTTDKQQQLTTDKSQPSTSKAPTLTSRPLPPLKSNDNKFFLYTGDLPPDVTVVTAYFNLGSFKKGSAGVFNTDLYMKWAAVYRYNRNPLVFYTDSDQIADSFRALRAGYENITEVIAVKRKSLWAFSWVDRIRKIYSDINYPKHHPNTVVPEYSCAQHAKYNVVEESVKQNYFNTTYFTWIDFGYFRDIIGRNKEFVITKPLHFKESKVAMNKVVSVSMDESVENIFKGNQFWIGGGMFFGSKHTLPTFIADYKQAVERYLNMSLSSTDQQVIYAMNTNKEKLVLRQRVPIQQYIPNGSGDPWFYLGYSSYRELS